MIYSTTPPYTEEERLILNQLELLLWPEQVAILLFREAEKCKSGDDYQPLLINNNKTLSNLREFLINKVRKGESFFYPFLFIDHFAPGIIGDRYNQEYKDAFNRESRAARRHPELADGGIRQWHCFPVATAFDGNDISLFTIESAANPENPKELEKPVPFENASCGSAIGHVKSLARDMGRALDKTVKIYFGYAKMQIDKHSCPIFALENLKVMSHEKYNLVNQFNHCHVENKADDNFPLLNKLILDKPEDIKNHPEFLKNSQNRFLIATSTDSTTAVSGVEQQNVSEYIKQYSVRRPNKKEKDTATPTRRNCAIDFRAVHYLEEVVGLIEKCTPEQGVVE